MSSEREASIDAGISIWGECGEFTIDESVWRAWLTLARLHGWKPAGTASPAIDLETGFELDDSEREFLGKVGNDGGYGPPFKGATRRSRRITPALSGRQSQTAQTAC